MAACRSITLNQMMSCFEKLDEMFGRPWRRRRRGQRERRL